MLGHKITLLLVDIAGGAILERNSLPLFWRNNTVKGNSAHFGGGMFLTNGASITITITAVDVSKSMFEGNIAYDGGAFMCFGCSK